MNLSIAELWEYILQGREIEFHLEEIKYFLSYKWNEQLNPNCFPPIYIYNDTSGKIVFCGTLEELFTYQFKPNISFQNALHEFSFDYIL